jgi:hypothetical protein
MSIAGSRDERTLCAAAMIASPAQRCAAEIAPVSVASSGPVDNQLMSTIWTLGNFAGNLVTKLVAGFSACLDVSLPLTATSILGYMDAPSFSK